MTGLIVPNPAPAPTPVPPPGLPQMAPQTMDAVDPLSQVLNLIQPRVYVAGGFGLLDDLAICFPQHRGIKCYAMLAGECWLVVDTVAEPVHLRAGDCFILPRGLPFQLSTDLSLQPVHYAEARARFAMFSELPADSEGLRFMAGGHFALEGGAAEMLLNALPPIVHIRRESDKAAMRWSLERMREELREARPGAALMAQHLAYTMLLQALRLHLLESDSTTPGWLAALSDRQMSLAIAAMHNAPAHPWTVQTLAERTGMSRSVFAQRFRTITGTTPLEYLTRWRMLLAADRLTKPNEGLAAIAQSLGYESESAFGKAFRRTMGQSPREYARSVTR